MKTIGIAAIVLAACSAFAETNCRVVEFPDHYEAVCTGDAQQTPTAPPASSQHAQEQVPGQERFPVPEQTFEALMAAQAQAHLDDDEVRIEMSKLRRIQMETWLNSSARQ